MSVSELVMNEMSVSELVMNEDEKVSLKVIHTTHKYSINVCYIWVPLNNRKLYDGIFEDLFRALQPSTILAQLTQFSDTVRALQLRRFLCVTHLGSAQQSQALQQTLFTANSHLNLMVHTSLKLTKISN